MARKPKKRAPYLMVSPPTWELARAAYLGGQTAAEVAERFNIGLQNLRQNIYKHGWSKRALADARAAVQPDAVAASVPPPPSPAAEAEGDLLEAVLARARAALTSGRGAEASALLKAAREYVLVQQDVTDARAAIASGVEMWDAAQPARAGAVTETLMVQTLHSRWSRLSIEEQAARMDPDGSAGLKAWMEAQAAAAGSRKPER
jgi:hypothetical protein